MKRKIIGILVVMLLVSITGFTVISTVNIDYIADDNKETYNEIDFSTSKNIELGITNDNDWLPSDAGNNQPIYHEGNVGIGLSSVNPIDGKLHVQESSLSNVPIFERDHRTSDVSWIALRLLSTMNDDNMGDGFGPALGFYIKDDQEDLNTIGLIWAERHGNDQSGDIYIVPRNNGNHVEAMVVSHEGNVGIGKTSPEARLHVFGSDVADDLTGGSLKISNPGQNMLIDGNEIDVLDGDKILWLNGNSKGDVAVPVLQITGGSDIAEPFQIKDEANIEPGMIMVIDYENPGNLKISNKKYDRCVAGVISGAGGIKPGLRLTQDGTFEGTHHVALAGRIYALCDASYGSIYPGDLLTTSNTPGYAMKVTDYEKAQGAILGKAMTSLEQGQDLVLILVTLQ